jgi:orotate phosphoribosyltransferase
MKLVMIDDVATTGNSILNAIKQLQEAGSIISESYVIVNRLENANKAMDSVGVKLYQLTDILEITKILFEERLIDEEILEKIKKQIDQAS